MCSCENSVTFPLDKRLGEPRSTDKALLISLLKKLLNISMKYKVNITTCFKCEESGGRCASSEDSSSDTCVCFCRDG